jgi:hypothetical protein
MSDLLRWLFGPPVFFPDFWLALGAVIALPISIYVGLRRLVRAAKKEDE